MGQKHGTSAVKEGKTSLCGVTFIRQGKKMFERFFSKITLMKHSGPNSRGALVMALVSLNMEHKQFVSKPNCAADHQYCHSLICLIMPH